MSAELSYALREKIRGMLKDNIAIKAIAEETGAPCLRLSRAPRRPRPGMPAAAAGSAHVPQRIVVARRASAVRAHSHRVVLASESLFLHAMRACRPQAWTRT